MMLPRLLSGSTKLIVFWIRPVASSLLARYTTMEPTGLFALRGSQ